MYAASRTSEGNMMKNIFLTGFLAGAALFYSACDNASSANPEATIIEGNVSGYSQKGPFAKGAKVTLYEIDDVMHQTGTYFSTTIDNDSGKYNINNISMTKPYAWMVVEGEFSDEFTGKKSSSPLTLNGLVDLREGMQVNINVLSHLAYYRIIHLVNEGKSITEAKAQAEAEVLKAFGLESDKQAFNQMNILSNGEGDAKLLAVTLAILGMGHSYNPYEDSIKTTMSSAIETLAKIAYDIETDGTWDDTILINSMRESTAYFGFHLIYSDVERNMKAMGAKEIPNFEKFLKKFTIQDTLWGSCHDEDIVKKHKGDFNKIICHHSKWLIYEGFREEEDAPIDTAGKYKTFVDSRDGTSYKILTFALENGDSVTWMADLLKFKSPITYSDDEERLSEYAREYQIRQIYNNDKVPLDSLKKLALESEKFQGICPDGWRLPKKSDWDEMHKVIRNNVQIGELLIYPQFKVYRNSYTPFFMVQFSIEPQTNSPTSGDSPIEGYTSSDPSTVRCVKD